MEGQTVSHYRILERLGGGGMGVVYKAHDTKLHRMVALKFLPPELTRVGEAKQRFVQEAQAASALDDANICTVFDIDETPDGQMFLVMAYYEGGTLKARIGEGPMPIQEALDIATQVTHGLAKAHEAGIVHRDIKPANLIVTKSGVVKILDFGVAKLSGVTAALTKTGVTLGTVAYMAPEQLRGDDVDQRVDLWASGVVLYEMLTGQRPFRTENETALVHAILNDEPANLHQARPEVPARLVKVVSRLLERNRDARYRSAAELLQDLIECRPAATGEPDAGALWQALRRPRVAVSAAVVVLAAAGAGLWAWNQGAEGRWARREAIPEIRRLVQTDQLLSAFEVAERAERSIPQDPELAKLWPQVSRAVSIATTPAGAEVRFRVYSAPETAWKLLGRAPLDSVRMPQGVFRLQVAAEGYETRDTMMRVTPGEGPFQARYSLEKRDTVPDGMVAIPASQLDLQFVVLLGAFEPVPAPPYFIDRHEVSNEQYKAFIDGGGYRSQAHWKQPFLKDGRALTWQQAMAEFRDATGQPGPSTWSVGTVAEGQAKHPASGVSWYEAAAYCEFSGKSLPTIFHWGQAAAVNAAQFIAPMSNFSGKGTTPVGTSAGVSPSGTYDMAGNVKEWVSTASGTDRYVLGGAWDDPEYKFNEPEARAPFDRSSTNGFRCAKYGPEPIPAAVARSIPLPRRDYAREVPVSDQLFEAYRSQYLYDKRDLKAVVEATDDSAADWRREKVTFDAAYPGERVTAYLFLPKRGAPPYQTAVLFPGAGGFFRPSSAQLTPEFADFLLTSGRALMVPIYDGTYERNRDELFSGYLRADRVFKGYMIRWVQDFMRSVDYLQTRRDVDGKKLAYVGASWGGQAAPIVLAVEPRLAVAVLVLAGLPMQPGLPEADPINFVTRAKTPVLMLGGQYDFVFPPDSSQRPLFNMLGTPVADKRQVVFEGMGHDVTAKRNEIIREALGWLDKYLGAPR